MEPEDAAAFEVTERASRLVGWDYLRVGALDPVLTANLRCLAGYRHPRCLRPLVMALLEQAIVAPVELRWAGVPRQFDVVSFARPDEWVVATCFYDPSW
ncbi:hypothetical protein GFY24_34310 [Nocardia sp. SYP-A9097]|uniref:hypothetical protein n=1 Tax=Nocardia sp. SYP-A9097 TaxID=2663237 RepID=UPI0013218B93|nr:hypothetical protein [Nocardia sp. SYP-A9097]MRH92440.1 hypothetical protein [Nocardia sp. SYP-A9097]